ncbi:hypothetical protein RFI_00788 [Reticulomyxa filosa]|uniref:Uncharacterized protein n=1 Tax=Reticulomyxa filosa TaxID=46433 RepID=X6PCL6_RETFI|nr:hypothetical protein RFI_00788 [Reticulomyxa filosa]|eukprot:ETO36275.1 hypothetical protein RFI_00788 [Reticulomyxa filosa]
MYLLHRLSTKRYCRTFSFRHSFILTFSTLQQHLEAKYSLGNFQIIFFWANTEKPFSINHSIKKKNMTFLGERIGKTKKKKKDITQMARKRIEDLWFAFDATKLRRELSEKRWKGVIVRGLDETWKIKQRQEARRIKKRQDTLTSLTDNVYAVFVLMLTIQTSPSHERINKKNNKVLSIQYKDKESKNENKNKITIDSDRRSHFFANHGKAKYGDIGVSGLVKQYHHCSPFNRSQQ